MGVPDPPPPMKGEISGLNPAAKTCNRKLLLKESDSAYCQITLVFIISITNHHSHCDTSAVFIL